MCVAQVRPNTAPTVLLADAVGTLGNTERHCPIVTAALLVRAHRREVDAGRGQNARRRTECGGRAGAARRATWSRCSPIRRRWRPRASPARWRRAYLDCAGDLLHMLSEGTFPNVGDLAMSRSSPRVGDGFIRLDVDGVVVVRQPERDLGVSPDGAGRRARGPQPRQRDPAADLRSVRGAGTGQPRPGLAGRWIQHADGGRRRRRGGPAAHPAAGGARRRRRRGGADPRRHRGQAPRPGAAVQGRHDPRDPPPGQEQPADRGGAAAVCRPVAPTTRRAARR